MAMKGWRRVGIVLSVVWFLGFGVYLWLQPTFEAKLLDMSYHGCTAIYQSAEENAREFARDAVDMRERWMPGIEARRQECMWPGAGLYTNSEEDAGIYYAK
jgi:hypothetical protein